MATAWRLALASLVVFATCCFASRAPAFTTADADEIFSAYNRAFYFTNTSGGRFRATTDDGKTWFWERAEQMEMLLDVYDRTTNVACLTMFTNVFNGFLADHGATWERNDFNDDIMWMVIACARGYERTRNPRFLAAAQTNFDLCHARAWSPDLGGGLWWKTSKTSKNACVNGPAAIAAFLLFQISGDTNYLTKSKAIYRWERETLFQARSGRVCDAINSRGVINPRAYTYNQGTFIGAANFLGDTGDAKRAADFTMNSLSRQGLLPDYGQAGDGGGFNGICARWIARFMKDRGLSKKYEPWLQANAEAAWKVRRAGDGLSWSRWSAPTPAGPLYSWACSSSVVIMQVVPATE